MLMETGAILLIYIKDMTLFVGIFLLELRLYLFICCG